MPEGGIHAAWMRAMLRDMPKTSAKKKVAAATKASKRSKAWAKRVATKHETPKKVKTTGKKKTAATKTKKKKAVVKMPGGKDGPAVLIEDEDDAGDGDEGELDGED